MESHAALAIVALGLLLLLLAGLVFVVSNQGNDNDAGKKDSRAQDPGAEGVRRSRLFLSFFTPHIEGDDVAA